ncbi:peptidase domain-containing ABC transporter [Chitinophaga nivalis]|uniref:Peptidase domain-containing ABC transporter n=1 Tax=Chitinophaga nivalis TaxID=2991709 RepID=A0ABT3ILA4_9BACT|nr:peptidase domain-containing ABC transporter [Chitinophaga nivalis]MCW3465569.1 peptidase domain-containing ABC transporter [Chitinophaga nivalis]MCW3484740.1 peptidase domain-containing ABC transporter [Chitinophaga nivalis]
MGFPFYRQLDTMDCGPTCLRMVAKHYGRSYSLEYLRASSFITREGVSLLGIGEAAEKIGFRTHAVKTTFDQLDEHIPLPCILHWNQNHFVVLPPQNYNQHKKNEKILVADPGHGLVKMDKETFLASWLGPSKQGVVLILEPTEAFYQQKEEQQEKKGFRFLFSYLRPYRKYVLQLFLSVLIASMLSLVTPFLTQSLVDYGINHQNLGFVYLVLISQLVLFAGSTAIEMIRSWILLHMNSRININIISDFLIKLMKLPIRFFDTKMIGDIHQRIGDHSRIQSFLTGTTLSTLFSFVNLFVFAVVLAIYSVKILLVFVCLSAAAIGWIFFFLRRRKELDYKRFQRMSDNENVLFELITGMQEIKLNNCETTKRWEWEQVQARLYKISVKGLALGQYQQVGSVFFNQLKNILVSFISAREVMNGNMTLGMMLSVSYIIGQMNSPLDQLLGFIQAAQDARISLDRLGEIHNREEEESADHIAISPLDKKGGDIQLQQVSFQYAGPHSPFVLKDLNLVVPEGKVTAIVGTSGSGKTTLMKLLLQFYEPTDGKVLVGNKDLRQVSPKWWRNQCGSVMQDGFIFSGTIAKNIAVSDEKVDNDKLLHAADVANIRNFIEELPLGYQTKIGNSGNGISAGQKQRMQIARAVYKNPQYLFFDEATSALDANNERIIMENLDRFFEGRTVVVIAHRLSTVKNADQIIVLEKGVIVETGTHAELTARKGNYYELVKNQLELGS